ncbi:MAG: 3-phosphoserine/phosphohydroxythreonine transaminase [Deltaproteobacteria bacterium]|nr:3-phosphoserine/phosphohydroxythreonine transaminase [Deltaproteobacteria bacterium]
MNFNPGPAALPLSVLEEVKAEFLDFAGTGMSILEASHRGKEYEAVHNETQALLKELLGLGDDTQVLFMGGGATTQFALVPMNFLAKDKSADYLVTGAWSQKAVKEAKHFGTPNIAANTEENKVFLRIPRAEECRFTDGAAYVHLTSNNTIFGTQWQWWPETRAPLVADMSSDILSRPFPAQRFALIYAGAQKNLGPAGVTVIVVKKDFLAQAREDLPSLMSYKAVAKENSLLNTAPCFPIYVVGKTLKWLKGKGGLVAMEKENQAKGSLIYGVLDAHAGFYRAPVEKGSRSLMNVVFRLPSEELEAKFVSEAKAAGMVGLKGHRSAGGIRVSTYNAVPLEWVKAVSDFMVEFARKNG